MPEKQAQVNVYVEEEKKARWQDFLTESAEVSTMSQLVRSAVEHYVDSNAGRECVAGSEGEVEIDLSSIESQIQGLSGEIENLQGTMQAIREEVSTDKVDAGLQQAVLENLPKKSQLNDGERGRVPGEIADRINEDTSTVSQALEILDESTDSVRSHVHGEGGQRVRYYWRR